MTAIIKDRRLEKGVTFGSLAHERMFMWRSKLYVRVDTSGGPDNSFCFNTNTLEHIALDAQINIVEQVNIEIVR